MSMNLFENEAVKKLLPGGARLFLGTSGYSFPHWKGIFYPERIAGKNWLKYYALRFSSVEINSTYYRILTEKATAAMSRSVPEGFSFSVKLHSSMTHSRDADKEQWNSFSKMIDPFRESGKMGMVLAQFPWSFPLDELSFEWLGHVAEQLDGYSKAIEFRHLKWYEEEPMQRVSGMGFTPVSLDLPGLSGLPETGLIRGGGNIYLRLHGRNSENWWGNTQERYDYLYNVDELRSWAVKLIGLSSGVKSCYVFFNNCHMGKAALNAQDMEKLLFQKVPEAEI
jgi:uncharacterized protein YecE (DUF72 family)